MVFAVASEGNTPYVPDAGVRSLYICVESFKAGASFCFRHITSPIYILSFMCSQWYVVICRTLKLYNSYLYGIRRYAFR